MLDILTENFDAFASGLWVTTRLVLASFFVALVVGTVVAALRVSPSPGRRTVGAVYVESFRNTPLLVLLFISCAGLRRAEVDISAWTAGIASLGVYTSASVAEALRSCVTAVSRGRSRRACRSGSDSNRGARLKDVCRLRALRAALARASSPRRGRPA